MGRKKQRQDGQWTYNLPPVLSLDMVSLAPQ